MRMGQTLALVLTALIFIGKESHVVREHTQTNQSKEAETNASASVLSLDSYQFHIDALRSAMNSSNITLIQMSGRGDRLGSNIQRPLFLLLYCYCLGVDFCIAPQAKQLLGRELSFPICKKDASSRIKGRWALNDDHTAYFQNASMANSTSYYGIHVDDKVLGRFANGAKSQLGNICKSNQKDMSLFAKAWNAMIHLAPHHPTFANDNASTIHQELMNPHNQNVTTVAVHIRRGDIRRDNRNDIFMDDEIFLQAITRLRNMIRRVRPSHPPEVHLFSENYGMVNWTLYEDIVEYFHLADQMSPPEKRFQRMDTALNLRDWRAFLDADIFLSSGTSFARIPSLARDVTTAAAGASSSSSSDNDYLPWTLIVDQSNRGPQGFPFDAYTTLAVQRYPTPKVLHIDKKMAPPIWQDAWDHSSPHLLGIE